jgi:hypothetical protein
MFAIEAQFVNRAALREALIESFAEGGLFIEGEFGITSGSAVTVRVAAAGLAAGLFLDGVVQWRRMVPHGRGSGAAAGLGVRMLPNQRERYQFLHRWASGSTEGSGRAEWRYPYEKRVVVAPLARQTGRVLHAILRDVSVHGAMITAPMRLSPSSLLSLEIPLDDGPQGLAARVAWATDDRAGLRLLLERREERLAWARFFETASVAFERRLVGRRRSSSSPRNSRAE